MPKNFRKNQQRSAGIVIHNEKILLMQRLKFGQEYYAVPGGTIESGENPEDAAKREIKEETSLDVVVGSKVYQHIYPNINGVGHYFLCEYVSGEPYLPEDSEEALTMKYMPDNQFKPMWVSLGELSDICLYPLEVRDWIIADAQNGFPEQVRVVEIDSTALRQAV